ncbi:MAG: hypothetical protein ACERKN_11205 [Velocimicrobium sp.]
MDKLFSDDDLADLLAELDKETNKIPVDSDPEMEAAQRRYTEIIKKHKDDK